MRKAFISLLPVMAILFSCTNSINNIETENLNVKSDGTRAYTGYHSPIPLSVKQIETGHNKDITSIHSSAPMYPGRDVSNSFLMAVGDKGLIMKSDNTGSNWNVLDIINIQPSIQNVRLNKIVKGYMRHFSRWIAIGDSYVLFSRDEKADSWFNYYSVGANSSKLLSIGMGSDSRATHGYWYMGGESGVNRPMLSHTDTFWEYTYRVDNNPALRGTVTDMTSNFGFRVTGVTTAGEIVGFNEWSNRSKLISWLPAQLNAISIIQDRDTRESKVYVVGNNGFIAYAPAMNISASLALEDTKINNWEFIEPFTDKNLNAVVKTNSMLFSPNQCDRFICVGGDDGTFAYSFDGQSFYTYDIGFGDESILCLYYYEPINAVFAGGTNGKMTMITLPF